jgi:hypothetical protein
VVTDRTTPALALLALDLALGGDAVPIGLLDPVVHEVDGERRLVLVGAETRVVTVEETRRVVVAVEPRVATIEPAAPDRPRRYHP